MKNSMKYITILDFGTGIVHQLTIDNWNIDEETCQEYMERIGFNSENCLKQTYNHLKTLPEFSAATDDADEAQAQAPQED